MYPWVRSFGGPLLFLPSDSVHLWSGSFSPDGDDEIDEEETEYWRVSEQVEDYAEPVNVGGVEALAIANGGCPTTFLADHGLIVQEMGRGARGAVDLALEVLLRIEWNSVKYWNSAGPGLLFDSALYGPTVEPAEWLALDIEPGRYAVQSAYWRSQSPNVGALALTRLTLVPVPGIAA
jgi:hypothetical protein